MILRSGGGMVSAGGIGWLLGWPVFGFVQVVCCWHGRQHTCVQLLLQLPQATFCPDGAQACVVQQVVCWTGAHCWTQQAF
jgi:hypothetical protein